jgi:hypothetical protein
MSKKRSRKIAPRMKKSKRKKDTTNISMITFGDLDKKNLDLQHLNCLTSSKQMKMNTVTNLNMKASMSQKKTRSLAQEIQ